MNANIIIGSFNSKNINFKNNLNVNYFIKKSLINLYIEDNCDEINLGLYIGNFLNNFYIYGDNLVTNLCDFINEKVNSKPKVNSKKLSDIVYIFDYSCKRYFICDLKNNKIIDDLNYDTISYKW